MQHEASSWIDYSEDQHQGWVCSLKNIQYPTLQNPSQRLNTNWYSENGKFSGYALGPGNPMILGIHSWMRCSQWGLVALFLPGFDALHLIVQVCGTVENLVLHPFMVDGAVRRLSQRSVLIRQPRLTVIWLAAVTLPSTSEPASLSLFCHSRLTRVWHLYTHTHEWCPSLTQLLSWFPHLSMYYSSLLTLILHTQSC